jgi:RNA polymerase sigma-70 factor (ECF subfamily)
MQAQTEFSRELLFSELAIDLKKFIARRVTNTADAEDVLQETLIKIHRSINCLAPNSNLYAWVYKVTRNTIIDHHRKQQSNSLSLDTTANIPKDFEQRKPSREVLQEMAPCLRPMLEQLPEKYREAIVLADLEGISQVELADRLGLSLSGAKSRVQRARQQLKNLFADCCQFELDHSGRVMDYECKKPFRC